jgi:hypothetical protein
LIDEDPHDFEFSEHLQGYDLLAPRRSPAHCL